MKRSDLEAVEAGTVKIVGISEDDIFAEASRLLDDATEYAKMARSINPYGDGHARKELPTQ